MSKQIRDLKKEVLKISQLTLDRRFKSWVKWVDSVDTSKTNGYAFVGDFVKDGTIEIEVGQPRLLLAQATSGSMKYNSAYYQIVKLNEDGSLTALDISDNDQNLGWALRIRDSVKNVLDSISNTEPENPLTQFSNEELLAEIKRRGI